MKYCSTSGDAQSTAGHFYHHFKQATMSIRRE